MEIMITWLLLSCVDARSAELAHTADRVNQLGWTRGIKYDSHGSGWNTDFSAFHYRETFTATKAIYTALGGSMLGQSDADRYLRCESLDAFGDCRSYTLWIPMDPDELRTLLLMPALHRRRQPHHCHGVPLLHIHRLDRAALGRDSLQQVHAEGTRGDLSGDRR